MGSVSRKREIHPAASRNAKAPRIHLSWNEPLRGFAARAQIVARKSHVTLVLRGVHRTFRHFAKPED